MALSRHILATIGICTVLLVTCTILWGDDQSFVPENATLSAFSVDEHLAWMLKPAGKETKTSRGWVWFAPTLLALKVQPPNVSNRHMFWQLIDHDIWIAGIDVGESYGNPAGTASYGQFYEHMVKDLHLSSRPCLLAESRGGLMLYNWAIANPKSVGCIAGIFPVVDIKTWPRIGDKELLAAATAYNLPVSEFRQRISPNNPIEHLGSLANEHVQIFSIHGEADKIVSLDGNSRALKTRYEQLGGKVTLKVVPGKGHEEIDEYFKSIDLMQFLLQYSVRP